MFEHQVREVVGCWGIFGLNRESLLLQGLGLLPIPLRIVERGEGDVETERARGELDGTSVAGNALLDFPPGNLEPREQGDSIGVFGVERNGPSQRSLRLGGLVSLELGVPKQEVERGVARRPFDTGLKSLDRVGRTISRKVE